MDIARQTFRALAALTAAVALSACGGGGGGGGATNAGDATDATNATGAGDTGSAPGSSTVPDSTTAGGTPGSGGGSGAASPGTDGTSTGGTSGATDPAAAGSTPPGTPVVDSAGSLQTSITPTSYPSGSPGGNSLDSLNTVREAAGAGLLNQSPALDLAADAHVKYLSANIGAMGPIEEATKFNFFAASPPERIAKAGFSASYSIEAISVEGPPYSSDCVQHLLNSVYRAVALLSPATHVGFGFGANFATTPICVSDLATLSSDAYGQVRAAGALLRYPYEGQTGVLEAFSVNRDSPRPSLDLFPDDRAGTPVIVSVRNANYLNFLAAGTLNAVVTKFELTDQGGNRLEAEILANPSLQAGPGVVLNADANLPAGFAVLVPRESLLRAHDYTAAFSATLKAGGPALEKTWHFTTRP